MKNQPLVSVIVPVYNIQNYIKRCIESLLSQSEKSLEIIVVDDGSTDNSGKIVDELKYKDERIKVIHQINGGLSASRNTGLDCATGKYILFVDGDDFFDDLNAIKVLSCSAERFESEVVLFSYKKCFKGKKTQVYLPIKNVGNIEDVKEDILRKLVGPSTEELSDLSKIERLNTAWGKLYRKDSIGNILFVDTNLIGVEDGWFNILVFSKVSKVRYEDEVFYCYEKSNVNSLLHNYNKNYYQKRKRAFELVEEFLTEQGLKGWNMYLQNHIAAEIFGIVMKMCDSNLSWNEKNKEIGRLLRDDVYGKAVKDINIKKIKGIWKCFFIMCKMNVTFAIIMVGDIFSWKKKRI